MNHRISGSIFDRREESGEEEVEMVRDIVAALLELIAVLLWSLSL